MSQTTLFVVNPIAGDRNKNFYTTKIDSWAKSSNRSIEVWETTGEEDLRKLKDVLDTHAPEKVVAVGGDGTLMLCAQSILGKSILLGFIPAGSANGMAAELNIPEKVEKALEIIEQGEHIEVDMLCFNASVYGLHISDMGLNARLVKNFENSGKRGFLGYAEGILGELIRLESFTVRLRLDGKEIEENCYMVAFANARRYGTGALLNHLGEQGDGKFEVCILKKFDLAGIAGQFLDMLDEESEHLDVYQAEEVWLETDEAQAFQVDGELQEDTRKLHVKIIPRCLRVIVPRHDA